MLNVVNMSFFSVMLGVKFEHHLIVILSIFIMSVSTMYMDAGYPTSKFHYLTRVRDITRSASTRHGKVMGSMLDIRVDARPNTA